MWRWRVQKRQVSMRGIIPFVLISSFCGCAAEAYEENDEEVEGIFDALRAENSLSVNALRPNGIAPNGIAPNGIAPNGLDSGNLSQGSKAALSDSSAAGRVSREFIRYAVSCAFADGDSFTFEGPSGPETYPGSLGLAPEWKLRGLTEKEQRWVSACMAARTNYFGQSVQISLQGNHRSLSTTGGERSTYSQREGAFWGNLFADAPVLNACYYPPNARHSRGKQRVCATLDESGKGCGVLTSLGTCGSDSGGACGGDLIGDGHYAECRGYQEVITTFLTR
jgi:hypothetical protein